ncbi:MAG TPA: hypothetical protein VFC78_22480 [Tepidisphaeraceae bacterium]|nr:hypothetical protein [Tepidisphaeraceae bacterium]
MLSTFFPRYLLPMLLLVSVASAAPPAATQPAGDRAAMEKGFDRTMSNAVLVGHFTVDGNKGPAAAEHYTLGNVRKLTGKRWLFDARIQYGSHDLTLPLTLTVEWAGDTPVITVDKLGFPGMGEYSARVAVFNDHYAGVWTGGPTHQGTLSGKIEHPAALKTRS